MASMLSMVSVIENANQMILPVNVSTKICTFSCSQVAALLVLLKAKVHAMTTMTRNANASKPIDTQSHFGCRIAKYSSQRSAVTMRLLPIDLKGLGMFQK